MTSQAPGPPGVCERPGCGRPLPPATPPPPARRSLRDVRQRRKRSRDDADQQSCSPGAPPEMITDHVPAVPVSPDPLG